MSLAMKKFYTEKNNIDINKKNYIDKYITWLPCNNFSDKAFQPIR